MISTNTEQTNIKSIIRIIKNTTPNLAITRHYDITEGCPPKLDLG